jgi:hypothetical protein
MVLREEKMQSDIVVALLYLFSSLFRFRCNHLRWKDVPGKAQLKLNVKNVQW